MKLSISINGTDVFETMIQEGDELSLNVCRGEAKRLFNEEQLNIFNEARKAFPGKKRGNDTEFDNFRRKTRDWKDVITLLLPAINNQIRDKAKRRFSGGFVPEWANLQTWINQRRWEEDITVPTTTTLLPNQIEFKRP
jgi:hypothetical protein